MRKFRYDTQGKWYKGNTHIHSKVSDGGKDFASLAKIYARAGYDFLFRTDHWAASQVQKDPQDYPLIWLDGVELDGFDENRAFYHVVGLGKFKHLSNRMSFSDAMNLIQEQNGILILAHPHWSGNSLKDTHHFRFHGVEIYNHVCRWLNGKSDGSVYWNYMLFNSPDTLAFAVDDAHILPEHPSWNGGWIMANMTTCTRESILTAIRCGNYYSTCGPEIHSIHYDRKHISVTTSPVHYIRLVGTAYQGERFGLFNGPEITNATFEIPEHWPYAYIEIEDFQGKRAWTNNLFKANE